MAKRNRTYKVPPQKKDKNILRVEVDQVKAMKKARRQEEIASGHNPTAGCGAHKDRKRDKKLSRNQGKRECMEN